MEDLSRGRVDLGGRPPTGTETGTRDGNGDAIRDGNGDAISFADPRSVFGTETGTRDGNGTRLVLPTRDQCSRSPHELSGRIVRRLACLPWPALGTNRVFQA